MSRFDELDKPLTQQDIAFSAEASRMQAVFEQLHASENGRIAIVDENTKDYFQSIVVPRMPATLTISSFQNIEEPGCSSEPAYFGHTWLISKMGAGEVVDTTLPDSTHDENPKPRSGFTLMDRLQLHLSFRPPYEDDQYQEALEPEIRMLFWSLDTTDRRRFRECFDALEQVAIPNMQILTGESYFAMDHNVVLPIKGLTVQETGERLVNILPLVTPFVLERDPK